MIKKVLTPMHITDVQRSLDTAKIWNQTVDLWVWEKSTADITHLKGWYVIGGHWRGGTHNMKNMVSGAVRKIRDINIFKFNGHEVYV